MSKRTASSSPDKNASKKSKKEKPIAFYCCLHGNLDYDMNIYFPNLEEHMRTMPGFTNIPKISNNEGPFYHPGNEKGVTPMCPTDYFVEVPKNITVVDMSLPDESILVNWPVEHYMLEILERNTKSIQKYIEKGTTIPNSARGDSPDIGNISNLLMCNTKIYYSKQTIPNVLLTTDESTGLYNARIIDGGNNSFSRGSRRRI